MEIINDQKLILSLRNDIFGIGNHIENESAFQMSRLWWSFICWLEITTFEVKTL